MCLNWFSIRYLRCAGLWRGGLRRRWVTRTWPPLSASSRSSRSSTCTRRGCASSRTTCAASSAPPARRISSRRWTHHPGTRSEAAVWIVSSWKRSQLPSLHLSSTLAPNFDKGTQKLRKIIVWLFFKLASPNKNKKGIIYFFLYKKI